MSSFLTQRSDEVVFFTDPGHGWLRVEHSELAKLDLLSKVSVYRYQSDDGRYVYLEEDLDMGTYIKALNLPDFQGWFNNVPRIYDDNEILRNSDDLSCFRSS